MKLQITIFCVIFGLAAAQRGHYAGNSGPIVGSRYQNEQGQSNLVAPANNFNQAPSGNSQNSITPENRFGGVNPYYPGPVGFPQAFQPFPFAPYPGFNGR